jgi:hypothetical protein
MSLSTREHLKHLRRVEHIALRMLIDKLAPQTLVQLPNDSHTSSNQPTTNRLLGRLTKASLFASVGSIMM